MAMYKQINDDTLILSQQAIYGSSRLGVLERDEIVSIDSTIHTQTPTIPDPLTEHVTHWTRGHKRYELTNHLGNVLATVSDRKIPVYANNNFSYYKAEVMTANDYYAFGMAEPKRSFDTSDYRFWWNTQERVKEIQAEHQTAPFWEYDPRAVQRWNTDPVVKVWESPYMINGGNPIWYNDPNGDDLDVGSNETSKNDVTSLVSEKNRKYLSFDNNHVGLNFNGLDEKGKTDLLKSDEGLNLVNDLVSSDKKFLYEASDFANIRDEDGNKLTGATYTLPHNIINASEGGKDSQEGHSYRPREGYDGQVIINPGAKFEETDFGGTVIQKSRASIVFHELGENYERTHNNIDYNDKNGKKGAHSLSNDRERRWKGRSYKPGEVSRVIPGVKPSKESYKEMGGR